MYFVLTEDYNETHVFINDIPPTLQEQYELVKGVSRLGDWPDDVVFQYSNSRPEGLILTDWVDNDSGWLIISDRFKGLLEAFPVPGIEYLPVKIKNHKGRMASDRYWIGNLLPLVEAVDRDRSDFKPDRGNVGGIRCFKKLALRPEVIQGGPPIFRLKETPEMVLLRDDLVVTIEKQRLTGMKFVETSRFDSFG